MNKYLWVFALVLYCCAVCAAQNNALSFDGGTDQVTCGDAAFQSTNGTWECWFKASSTSGYQAIIGKEAAGYSDNEGLIGIWEGYIGFHIHISPSTEHNVQSNSTVTAGTWYHVAVTWGSGGMKMYVDGTLQTDTDAHTGPIAASGKNFTMGARHSDDWPFAGDIDEVRVWNVALSQGTISSWKDKYVDASHPNFSNLVAVFSLDEDKVGQTSGTVVDTKNDNDGYNSGATWVASSVMLSGSTLPVQLASCTASNTNEGVLLEWTTQSEFNNLGFTIERSLSGSEWTLIASYESDESLIGRGSTSNRTDYHFIDESSEPGMHYYYRILSVDVHGSSTDVAFVEITVDALPTETILLPAYPNPFNPRTNIRYRLSEERKVSLRVVDLSGRTVHKIFAGSKQNAGTHSAIWNGRNSRGELSASGLYLIHLQAGKKHYTEKVLFVR